MDLNIPRTKLVTHLQYNYVGRHIKNSLLITTSDENYKDKVFPDGEFLHATIKYEDQCISCTTIKPKDIIHIKRALDFFYECTEYIILDEELDDRLNSPLIHFNVYTNKGKCEKYGIITNGPTLCNIREENDDIMMI